MLSNAWFTVNFFHVSFGKQDLIQNAILQVKEIESITIDENREVIIEKLKSSSNKQTEKSYGILIRMFLIGF